MGESPITEAGENGEGASTCGSAWSLVPNGSFAGSIIMGVQGTTSKAGEGSLVTE